MSPIRFLKRKEIDGQKWNDSVAHSLNSLPYAFAWYLDSVAENWDALVMGDYETIMPLVWMRKLGIKCLYQPYYCQQLGIFGKGLSKEKYRQFLDYIAQRYSYVSINLHPGAQIVSDEYHLKPRKNLLLHLNKEYEQLKKGYSENHSRNIKKAVKAKIFISEDTALNHFQKFYLENVNRKQENFKNKHERIFKQLTKVLIENGSGRIFSAISEDKKMLAACLLILHQNRIINIINTSSKEGKNTGASHFLFDSLIQKYADNKFILDFEGSSIPTIARFYEGFGAEQEVFYNYYTTILKRQGQRFS